MTTAPARTRESRRVTPQPVKADWIRALQRTAGVDAASRRTLAAIIAERAERHPDRPALIGEDDALSYRELSVASVRYARWAIEHGLRKGDCVGLMMGNCPHYVAIWLGLTRVGVSVALINPHLVGVSLVHCIQAVGLSLVVADTVHLPGLLNALTGAIAPAILVHGADYVGFERIDSIIERLSPEPLGEDEGERPVLSDTALFIYTSGTTGLPKAAVVSHYRVVMWSEWFAGILDLRGEDRLYNCLPLCHSVGGVVGTGSALAAGASVVLRRGFSASRFWEDIAASDATIFLYIGQLCRYLLAARDGDESPLHNLRLCFGNGLSADAWEPFVQRFDIPRIIEFYAATEGSFSLFNLEGEPGAIGRIPEFIAHRSPVALVKFDFASEQPIRDAAGRCVRCATQETGEALGRVASQSSQLATRFEGYVQREETEKKVLRDVFVRGDAWFRTGDLMRQDERGYFYFVDRIGDTFRWKGENVSTSEVEAVLCATAGVAHACVYGVEIPGTEGRCGMAALVVDNKFDLGALRRRVGANLPSYARPVFLRLCGALSITETFKLRKRDYIREGYDPSLVGDWLFVADDRQQSYRPFDKPLYEAVQAGRYFGRRE